MTTTTGPVPLRRYRRMRLFSQREFAERLGIRQSTLAAIESGRQRPQLRTIRQITEVLGIKPRTITEFVEALDKS